MNKVQIKQQNSNSIKKLRVSCLLYLARKAL